MSNTHRTAAAPSTPAVPPPAPPAPAEPRTISPAPAPDIRTIAPGTINEQSFAHVRLQLPPHVYHRYADQAKASGKDPEVEMAGRLLRCQEHNVPGLWLSPEQKQELEKFLGRGISDGASAMQWLRPLRGMDVSGVHIEIPAHTLKRLTTRVMRNKTLEGLIREIVIKALRQYVGELPY